MKKLKGVMIAFLILGGAKICMNYQTTIEKLQVEKVELQTEKGVLEFLLDNCVDDRAEKLIEAREENFIPSPGRFYAQEIDLHDLISEFFSNNDEQRICFGRGWARSEKELD